MRHARLPCCTCRPQAERHDAVWMRSRLGSVAAAHGFAIICHFLRVRLSLDCPRLMVSLLAGRCKHIGSGVGGGWRDFGGENPRTDCGAPLRQVHYQVLPKYGFEAHPLATIPCLELSASCKRSGGHQDRRAAPSTCVCLPAHSSGARQSLHGVAVDVRNQSRLGGDMLCTESRGQLGRCAHAICARGILDQLRGYTNGVPSECRVLPSPLPWTPRLLAGRRGLPGPRSPESPFRRAQVTPFLALILAKRVIWPHIGRRHCCLTLSRFRKTSGEVVCIAHCTTEHWHIDHR